MKTLILSDTHGDHENIKIQDKFNLIIHSGDFTRNDIYKKENFYNFIDWYAKQNGKYKILVAGNHDGFIEENKKIAKDYMNKKEIIYLEDNFIDIEGIKFYGTPWTPEFLDWYFMLDEFELIPKFNHINEDTNVLITHGPPKGILDKNLQNIQCGSNALKNRIKELKNLKYCIFGHIHEGRGSLERNGVFYINASHRRDKEPIIINLD